MASGLQASPPFFLLAVSARFNPGLDAAEPLPDHAAVTAQAGCWDCGGSPRYQNSAVYDRGGRWVSNRPGDSCGGQAKHPDSQKVTREGSALPLRRTLEAGLGCC